MTAVHGGAVTRTSATAPTLETSARTSVPTANRNTKRNGSLRPLRRLGRDLRCARMSPERDSETAASVAPAGGCVGHGADHRPLAPAGVHSGRSARVAPAPQEGGHDGAAW